MPVRTRGIAAGLLLLAVSPVIALTGAHHHGAVAVATTPAGPAITSSPVVVAASRVETTRSLHLSPPRDPSVGDAEANIQPVAPAPVVKPVVRKPAPAAPLTPQRGPPASPGSIIAIIEAAAAKWGVDPNWMIKIARCESGLRPTAVNPHGFYGLFQFYPPTFKSHGGTNIFDPVQQADIAGFMLSHGGARAWSCA